LIFRQSHVRFFPGRWRSFPATHREKEKPENGKHDKKLGQYDDPQLFTQRPHVPEALVVEFPHAFEMIHLMAG